MLRRSAADSFMKLCDTMSRLRSPTGCPLDREQSVKTASAVATVITAEDIRNYGIRNVVEALRLVPGMHQGMLATYQPIVTVRGFSSFSGSPGSQGVMLSYISTT